MNSKAGGMSSGPLAPAALPEQGQPHHRVHTGNSAHLREKGFYQNGASMDQQEEGQNQGLPSKCSYKFPDGVE